MNYLANARLMLTKCRDCLGCNLLENENFRGDNNCRNFRNGVSKKVIEKENSIEMADKKARKKQIHDTIQEIKTF